MPKTDKKTTAKKPIDKKSDKKKPAPTKKTSKSASKIAATKKEKKAVPLVLTVPNFHVEECGHPPNLTAGGSCYTSYFENKNGEQLVFVMEKPKSKLRMNSKLVARIYHGDAGWSMNYELSGTNTIDVSSNGLNLDPFEEMWCRVCWMTALYFFVHPTSFGDQPLSVSASWRVGLMKQIEEVLKKGLKK